MDHMQTAHMGHKGLEHQWMHKGLPEGVLREGGGARWGLLMVSVLLRLTLGEGWRPERLLYPCSGWLSDCMRLSHHCSAGTPLPWPGQM